MKTKEIEELLERMDNLESKLVCERGEYRDGWKSAFQTVRYELEAMIRTTSLRCVCGSCDGTDCCGY